MQAWIGYKEYNTLYTVVDFDVKAAVIYKFKPLWLIKHLFQSAILWYSEFFLGGSHNDKVNKVLKSTCIQL